MMVETGLNEIKDLRIAHHGTAKQTTKLPYVVVTNPAKPFIASTSPSTYLVNPSTSVSTLRPVIRRDPANPEYPLPPIPTTASPTPISPLFTTTKPARPKPTRIKLPPASKVFTNPPFLRENLSQIPQPPNLSQQPTREETPKARQLPWVHVTPSPSPKPGSPNPNPFSSPSPTPSLVRNPFSSPSPTPQGAGPTHNPFTGSSLGQSPFSASPTPKARPNPNLGRNTFSSLNTPLPKLSPASPSPFSFSPTPNSLNFHHSSNFKNHIRHKKSTPSPITDHTAAYENINEINDIIDQGFHDKPANQFQVSYKTTSKPVRKIKRVKKPIMPNIVIGTTTATPIGPSATPFAPITNKAQTRVSWPKPTPFGPTMPTLTPSTIIPKLMSMFTGSETPIRRNTLPEIKKPIPVLRTRPIIGSVPKLEKPYALDLPHLKKGAPKTTTESTTSISPIGQNWSAPESNWPTKPKTRPQWQNNRNPEPRPGSWPNSAPIDDPSDWGASKALNQKAQPRNDKKTKVITATTPEPPAHYNEHELIEWAQFESAKLK